MASSPRSRTVLVTGGNSGIGLECARRLAREGFRVVIASRNRTLSDRVVAEIVAATGNDAVEERALDLGSQQSVRQFAKDWLGRREPLHALVCNAGVQFNRGPIASPEGYELTFAVNHLGHFLLVNLLLESLLDSAPARIAVVSSGVHDPARFTGMPKVAIEDMESLSTNGGPAGPFDGRLAYVNSKLCNLWFTYELIRRVESAGLARGERPLSINAFEPGLVPGSGLARDYPPVGKFLWDRVFPVLRVLPRVNSAKTSGNALAELVLDPDLEAVSGRYFPSHTRFRAAPSSKASYDEARAAQLWEASAALTGLTADESVLLRAP